MSSLLEQIAKNKREYVLGRGVLYAMSSGGDLEDLGNCTELTMTFSAESLKHYSMRSRVAVPDMSVLLSSGFDLSFSLDEISLNNLGRWAGTFTSKANAAFSGFAFTSIVAGGDYSIGDHLDIMDSAGIRAYGVSAADMSVRTSINHTALAASVDFDLDSDMGRLFILDSAKIQTALSNGEGIEVYLDANISAQQQVDIVNTVTSAGIRGALKFVQECPRNSVLIAKREYMFHDTVMSPTDSSNMMTATEWTSLKFSGKVVKSPSNEKAATITNIWRV